jgi:hypothetical protein
MLPSPAVSRAPKDVTWLCTKLISQSSSSYFFNLFVYKKLKEEGVITEDEFSQLKNNLMKRMDDQ